ncbi:unnamed protein product [Closterium sp. NIES-53]
MAPGQQASSVDMAVEGAEDVEEEGLEAATSTEDAGVADMAMTTRTTDAVADGQEGRGAGGGRGRGRGGRGGRGGGAASMKSAGNESDSRDDRFPGQFFFVSTQAPAGPEKDEGLEEPAAVGKVTLHSLDYWVIDSDATYSMTPHADLLTDLEPSPVKHVISALGQRGTSKLGEHEESGVAAQKQHKGEENPKAAAEEEYGENIDGVSAIVYEVATAEFQPLVQAYSTVRYPSQR